MTSPFAPSTLRTVIKRGGGPLGAAVVVSWARTAWDTKATAASATVSFPIIAHLLSVARETGNTMTPAPLNSTSQYGRNANSRNQIVVPAGATIRIGNSPLPSDSIPELAQPCGAGLKACSSPRQVIVALASPA